MYGTPGCRYTSTHTVRGWHNSWADAAAERESTLNVALKELMTTIFLTPGKTMNLKNLRKDPMTKCQHCNSDSSIKEGHLTLSHPPKFECYDCENSKRALLKEESKAGINARQQWMKENLPTVDILNAIIPEWKTQKKITK